AFLAASLGETKERGFVTVWDLAKKEQLWSHSEADGIPAVAFAPDGRALAIGTNDRKAHLLDAATGRVMKTFEGPSPARALAFSPDGKSLAVGGGDQTIRLWDVATGAETRSLHSAENSLPNRIEAVAFSPNGQCLLAAGRATRLWDVASAEEKR